MTRYGAYIRYTDTSRLPVLMSDAKRGAQYPQPHPNRWLTT